jgi:hypothetical protein
MGVERRPQIGLGDPERPLDPQAVVTQREVGQRVGSIVWLGPRDHQACDVADGRDHNPAKRHTKPIQLPQHDVTTQEKQPEDA